MAADAFDLVAVDHHMPGKDGRAMLDEIVALPDHPPVVFVTGNDDTSVAVEAIHAGASDFVVKTVGESFFDLLAGRFRQALLRDRLEREKRQAEVDLREANARLEVLIREVHHRVSNSLQMVSSFVAMQAGQTEDSAAREALAATQSRIQAVSQVHRRLYTRSDVATIDLDEYLSTLVEELQGSLPRGAGDIALALEADPVEVSADQAVSIGIIVNELVSNAAKYAFPSGRAGTITVKLEARDGGFAVTVSDDGEGIDGAAGPKGTGLGMRIVKAIAKSLRSDVEEVPQPRGTSHRLVIRA